MRRRGAMREFEHPPNQQKAIMCLRYHAFRSPLSPPKARGVVMHTGTTHPLALSSFLPLQFLSRNLQIALDGCLPHLVRWQRPDTFEDIVVSVLGIYTRDALRLLITKWEFPGSILIIGHLSLFVFLRSFFKKPGVIFSISVQISK